MQITDLNIYTVGTRCQFVKIETDRDLHGWGEAVLEGQVGAVRAIIKDLREYLLGKDPRQIEKIWQAIYQQQYSIKRQGAETT